jgi:hypothetical protein
MLRFTLILSALAFSFYLLLPASTTIPGPATASAAADILQCMEKCIRHEGGNTDANKTTCKMRCAGVPSVFSGNAPANKDSGSCMSAYKDCRETCAGDKKCTRVCKKALMRCQ